MFKFPLFMKVYKSHPNARLDTPNTGDAGIDLRCVEDVTIPPFINNSTDLKPQWIVKVPTGIHIEIPKGWFGRVAPRSSIGAGKNASSPDNVQHPFGGISLMAEIIDSTYRNQIFVALANLTGRVQNFEAGTKIAQLIIQPHAPDYRFFFADSLDDLSSTERGLGGFGSTGVK